MTRVIHWPGSFVAAFGTIALLVAGCSGETGAEGLSVDVTYAPGVPRAARDEAVRVEVFLVDSCDSVTIGERADEAIQSMFVLRDGSAGPVIAIPEPGEYGLYAVSQDSNCAVVGAGCNPVTIDAGSAEPLSVELGAFSTAGCFANQDCSLETGECNGPSGDCVDLDSDGLGDGTRENVGCVNPTTDSNDADGTTCADTDGDSCDDCSNGSFAPLDDGDDGDADGICDTGDVCVDSDEDGLGDGTLGNVGCVDTATDSNDTDDTVCADTDNDTCDDCGSGSFAPLDDGTDSDGDGICDAGDLCVDMDGDGLGDGSDGNVGCASATTDSNDGLATVCADTDGDGCDDCSNGYFTPLDDGEDRDADGTCDIGDDCVDVDGDGLGDGSLGNSGCINGTTDSNDDYANVCADTDGDGCDDCAVTAFDPSNDGLDGDADGACALGDCDDGKPFCAFDCTDTDEDDYCIDFDCNDGIPTCDVDCTTNSDGGAHVDCFETFCGTNPSNSGSECREVSSQFEYENALSAANSAFGHDYIVLNSFTMIRNAPKLDDDAGVTIRQVAGAILTVNSGGDRLVFEVSSDNNVIDGVHVVNQVNARDLVQIQGQNNTVQNCVFEGFERRGIYVDGGDDAQILHNTITGGLEPQNDDKAAIIVKDSLGSVVAGNTVADNAMDGVQIRNAGNIFIDQNTVANNGGSGIKFYGDDSSGVCFRNNNVTGNGDYALNADKVVTFDTSSSCRAPLSPGTAYGNNDFDNDNGSCGGDDCLACGCLPSGAFWEYSVDPLYTSTTAGDRDLYCLGAPSLIDGGDDLVSYDLNGDAPGDFNGSSPDIGSREDGPGDCD